MSEYLLLAATLTCAVPYGYLIVAAIFRQPRQVATYVTVAVLLLLWPLCAFMSFMQLLPIFAMSAWWWFYDFSFADATAHPLRFGRPLPSGLVFMVLLSVAAAIASGLFAYFVWQAE